MNIPYYWEVAKTYPGGSPSIFKVWVRQAGGVIIENKQKIFVYFMFQSMQIILKQDFFHFFLLENDPSGDPPTHRNWKILKPSLSYLLPNYHSVTVCNIFSHLSFLLPLILTFTANITLIVFLQIRLALDDVPTSLFDS